MFLPSVARVVCWMTSSSIKAECGPGIFPVLLMLFQTTLHECIDTAVLQQGCIQCIIPSTQLGVSALVNNEDDDDSSQ